MAVIDLHGARKAQGEREKQLLEREMQDYRALLGEEPAQDSAGLVWWCFVRAPEPFEASADRAVVISARAEGLRLVVERKLWRRADSGPMPHDRCQISALMFRGECVCEGDAPQAQDAPRLGLRLNVSLSECVDRGRVVCLSSQEQRS